MWIWCITTLRDRRVFWESHRIKIIMSVWTKEIKASYLYHTELHSIIFFSLHRIALHRIVESNRYRIALHHNRGELYRIGSCFISIFNVSYQWYVNVSLAVHQAAYHIGRSQLWRCTSLRWIYKQHTKSTCNKNDSSEKTAVKQASDHCTVDMINQLGNLAL